MESQNNQRANPRKIGCRHVQVLISFLGLIVAGVHYSSLSIALVAMTSTKSIQQYEELNYSTAEKGLLLGMFTYGHVLGMVPAGYIVNFYSSVKTMAITNGILCGITSLLIPIAAINYGFVVMCLIRIVQGILQGFITPCIYAHLAGWVVHEEKEKFSWVWSGAAFGNFVCMLASGMLSSNLGQWQPIFYFSGCVGIVWGIACLIWAVDHPSSHSSISAEERDFIEMNISTTAKAKIPWLKIFTSVPVWALLLTHSFENWGMLLITSLTPTFLRDVFHFKIDEVAYFTALPYLSQLIFGFLFAFLALKVSKRFKTKVTRKLWTTIGLFGTSASVFVLVIVDNDRALAIVCLCLCYGLLAGCQPGFKTNYFDLGPNFVGITSGVGLFLANLFSMTGPMLSGYVLIDELNPNHWKIIFAMVASSYLIGNIIFCIFGSTKLQPWNT